MKKNIVFTGGGTAGHIMPNIAIIEEIKDNYNIYYIGTSGMEKEIIKKFNYIKFIEIPSAKFKRSISPQNILLPFKITSSTRKAITYLKNIQPALIFSKGGYVSIPTALAGHYLKIPVITHESDLSIGLANKVIGKISKAICCSFKSTADKVGKKGVYTGSPIRPKIYKGNKSIVISRHNINTSRPTILIIGGSQGAKAINNVIWENIDKLSQKYNIIHIVGKNNTNSKIKNKNYHQLEFVDDIENYFNLADIAISRAGSNTIFELVATTTPMILIPLPKTKHSRGDQVDNANYFKENNLASVILQENLNINTLTSAIESTLKQKNFYIAKMTQVSKTIGNKEIIKIIESHIKKQ